MVYAEAPWTFKGRALYQLQLVKADEARKYIPEELKLVEFCGYTLGGVYLARYDDSPAGTFDECVAMAGLVWNPPTSCAWAARVFVNNTEARNHGIKSVGLPSRLASFNTISQSANAQQAWWTKGQSSASSAATDAASSRHSSRKSSKQSQSSQQDVVELMNVDKGRRRLSDRPVAKFKLPDIRTSGFLGPRMRLSLPSFSGGTAEHPGLLQYSCDLQTNILPVAPIQIQLPAHSKHCCSSSKASSDRLKQKPQQQHPEVLDLLLDGKPLVCLAFSNMVMRVEEPVPLKIKAAPTAAVQQGSLAHALATVLPHK